MNDELDFNPDTEKYQNLHFGDDFDTMLLYALEDAKKYGLASLEEVLVKEEIQLDHHIQLLNNYLNRGEFGFDPINKALGFVRDSNFSYWLFIPSGEFVNADAIAVFLDREANDGHELVTDFTNDNYQIISHDPLILLSMYGSIHGFRKREYGAQHFLICDADADCWG